MCLIADAYLFMAELACRWCVTSPTHLLASIRCIEYDGRQWRIGIDSRARVWVLSQTDLEKIYNLTGESAASESVVLARIKERELLLRWRRHL